MRAQPGPAPRVCLAGPDCDRHRHRAAAGDARLVRRDCDRHRHLASA